MSEESMDDVLRARGLRLGYGDRDVVTDLDLDLVPGRITAIVGANASGKSTLLRALARLLTPTAGAVTLDGDDLARLPGRRVAKVIGLLPQQPTAPEGIAVADLVARGRYPHQGAFRRWSDTDEVAVQLALERTGIAGLADRGVDELSGGQRQRVWIAMALAQEPRILLLDEPTTFLDIHHQLEVLDLVRELNREQGTTVAMVLHDLNLAARYADELVVLADGRILASGAPDAVLTPDVLRTAFSLEARIIPDPVTGSPLVVPIGTVHPHSLGQPGRRDSAPTPRAAASATAPSPEGTR